MARFTGMAHRVPLQAKLDTPGRVPDTVTDTDIADAGIGPDGTRTNSVGFYPMSETRVNLADRVYETWQPSSHYANADPQKAGAPGTTQGSTGISSESPTAVTTMGGVPNSPRKLSFGIADWSIAYPGWPGLHQVIVQQANPNRPQVNPTPFNVEGPSANTRYQSPSPWAAGVYIG